MVFPGQEIFFSNLHFSDEVMPPLTNFNDLPAFVEKNTLPKYHEKISLSMGYFIFRIH